MLVAKVCPIDKTYHNLVVGIADRHRREHPRVLLDGRIDTAEFKVSVKPDKKLKLPFPLSLLNPLFNKTIEKNALDSFLFQLKKYVHIELP
jgi:hypothetical protein